MDYESLAKSIIRDLSIEDGAKLLADTFAELERESAKLRRKYGIAFQAITHIAQHPEDAQRIATKASQECIDAD